ncbi:amino acid transporter AAT family [Fusarium denticulatum]|uniref:Amino acid transporter AAT family n=1 Tax=Fusarium denticulatum TaxID=48507 RepID=A0A8H5TGX1_9HYPO|nr:amino acid transporter AAT family [Fusarium denticulatum]
MDKSSQKLEACQAEPALEHGTSTEYHELERKLESRHIQFIALGGAIGTGLFLGIGRALTQAGPLSLLLGYSISGAAVYCMMQSLGEMCTWLPLPGAIPQFADRWVDPALGFAIGWNSWYYCVITLCAEIAAVSVVVQYWEGAQGVNVAVWITILIVLVACINLFAVSVYGEVEFFFAGIKIIAIVGLILLAFLIDVGATGQGPIGFRYWKNPGAMKERSSLAVGVLVPSNDEKLLSAQANGSKGAAASPWVIAITHAKIKVLPSIINAVILSSASSSANAMTFNGSRYLYALSKNGQAPKIFQKCNKSGTPWVAVLLVTAISLLSYLSCSASSSLAFTWFQNLATLSSLFTWFAICLIYVRFHSALKAQGFDRSSLIFKAPFQPYLAWFSMFYFGVIIIFSGFWTFTPWNANSFVTTYIGIPLMAILFCFWKFFKKTKWVPSTEADLYRDKAAIDAIIWDERKPTTIWGKVWDWLC